MASSFKAIFSAAATILLSTALTAHAAESPAQPLNSDSHSAAEIMLPPPVAFEEGSDTRTYSLKDVDTVQQLDVKDGGANIINYNFSSEKARYYELHVHGKDVELTPIAIKPFWDVAADELAHARVMGCKAALETGLGDNNPYKEMSAHYLQTYCPHP